jgi:hypothetical protein
MKTKIARIPPLGSDGQATKPQLQGTDESEEAAKELSKLTANFTAALNRLLPIAERASRRGKHSLLRLISRKLPRLKIVAEDTEQESDDEPVEVIWDDTPATNRDTAHADQLRKRIEHEAKYGDSSELRTLIASMKAIEPEYQPPPIQPAGEDSTQTPAKTQAKTKVSPDASKPEATTCPVPAMHRLTSGAPRSQNEEPWPGQANFPRPKRGPMRHR